MSSDIRTKYEPQYLSELDIEYPKIVEYLNNADTFIINGSKNSGKSTIIKLYLKNNNYDYLLIDDYSYSLDKIKTLVEFKKKSVNCYFYDMKYIILIDNFEQFDANVKEYIIKDRINKYVIITEKYLNSKIQYVRISPYSNDYLIDLYSNIYFIENQKLCKYIPDFKNINEMLSNLEINMRNDSNISIDFDIFNYKYEDLILEKNIVKELTVIDKLSNYTEYQNNVINNISNIDDYVYAIDNICTSLNFLNYNSSSGNINFNEYYTYISFKASKNAIVRNNSLDKFRYNIVSEKKQKIKKNKDNAITTCYQHRFF